MFYDETTPWYCKKIPLAPFHIYFLFCNASLNHCKTKKRVMGFWALERLYIDGYKQIIGFGQELVIFEPGYIKFKKENAEVNYLMMSYSFIDKSFLPLDNKENKYFLIKIVSLSKNAIEMEYIDVSNQEKMVTIRKRWVRP